MANGEDKKTMLKTKPIIFTGPSISKQEIQQMLSFDVEIKNPIKRYDLENIPNQQELIAIIDGVFFSQLAVSAREIIILLKKGITILGSSSMGALRAAELNIYGMLGIGDVYEMYKSKEVQSDDEVALIFTKDTYRAISEPVINIRYSIKKAIERGILNNQEGEKIIEVARSVYFPKLNYYGLFMLLENVIPQNTLEQYKGFVEANREMLDVKRQDAIRLIKYINNNYFYKDYFDN